MIILGVTGSMASGKSSLVKRIRMLLKWPVWDADAEVQRLYKRPDVIAEIGRFFPVARSVDGIDRQKLRALIVQDPLGLQKLESVLYPPLFEHRQHFLNCMCRLRKPVVVQDIPLLFEKNLDKTCDVTLAVMCPEWLQKQRIMRRSGMSEALMNYLLANQMSQQEKKRLADIVIDSGLSYHHTWTQFMTRVVGKMQ